MTSQSTAAVEAAPSADDIVRVSDMPERYPQFGGANQWRHRVSNRAQLGLDKCIFIESGRAYVNVPRFIETKFT